MTTKTNGKRIEVMTHVEQPDIAFLPVSDVLDRLDSKEDGLQQAEVEQRLLRHGANSIITNGAIPVASLLRENFLHTMALLLWAAGVVAFLAEMPQLGIAIWLVNIINGTFSFWQEYQAGKATEALKSVLPSTVQALRDGNQATINASELVPGDIILINEGDTISADARILTAESLQLDQSTLTGESRLVRKTASIMNRSKQQDAALAYADIPNLVYAGTSVLSGHGTAVVYATGISTQFGHVARLTQCIPQQKSPLQKEMLRVTRIITVLALSVGTLMFVLATTLTHAKPEYAFIFAMGMIVAFVPEGMVPTVTLSLALAVKRMAKQNALVKRLSSVEALGCTNVICTDKTGTLTENQMTVTRAWADAVDYSFSGQGYSLDGNVIPVPGQTSNAAAFDELMTAAVLCNNASSKSSPDGLHFSGDPTEMALLVAAGKSSKFQKEIALQWPRIHEIGFDSHRKCMSTIHQGLKKKIAYVKGSPATILELCRNQLHDGNDILLSNSDRALITEQIDSYAKQGLRVLAVARKELLVDEFDTNSVENELTFLGLFGMFDPPRLEVPDAMKSCREAGIQVVMITGDYEITAQAIAQKIGMVQEGSSLRLVTGTELDHMTDQELVEQIKGKEFSRSFIFARVNPEHKLRIVQAFQKSGKIVAVTGDGVNDAPALKKADIGVAMGRMGTDVAREAADIILLDDNFATIVAAVREGRAVYDNIKKFTVYVFSSNLAEAVPFVLMLFSGGLIPLPLTMMQVLSIDLGTDMVPALGLGADPPAEGIMQRSPRTLSTPLLSPRLLLKSLLWYGAIESVAGISGYLYVNWLHGWPGIPLAAMGTDVWHRATTMTLTCIVAGQVGAVFCCRTQKESLFKSNPFQNRLILIGVLVELGMLACLIYVPAFQGAFDTASLSLSELLFAVCWVPAMVLLDEIRKLILRLRDVIPG